MMRLKWAYFRQLWSYVELGIIGCSWAGVSIYVWRHREMTRLGDLFRETKGYAYINLQMVSYVNDTPLAKFSELSSQVPERIWIRSCKESRFFPEETTIS